VIKRELTQFAAEQQRLFDASTSPQQRKAQGHFGTPPAIARFMAERFSPLPAETCRIIDPGAGVGTLSVALCQQVLEQKDSCSLYFELWENDPRLLSLLEQAMSHCAVHLQDAGHHMEYVIRESDFILENRQRSLLDRGPEASFHRVIMNPPYFKLRKESSHAQVMAHVVHGQPNIYALFMAVATDQLLPGGELVAITPRSYFNGPYFRRFRKWFFDRVSARAIHLFESRTEAFKEDAVLQESVILHAEKGGPPRDVILTTSLGRGLESITHRKVPYDSVIDNRNGDHVVRVTTSTVENDIIEAVDHLPHRFREAGFEISTGPVVTFRCKEFLRDERSNDTAPLLWMHNVRPFVTRFPPKTGKPTHIEESPASRKLLLPAKNYVLLKRFTSKEEKRRLVAGIFASTDSYSEWVGLENHLNYVYRKGSELTISEAYGLAAYFNSALVDRYFRAISGNTQVNATEIRGMPIPDDATLGQIGNQVRKMDKSDQPAIEQIIAEILQIPEKLADHVGHRHASHLV